MTIFGIPIFPEQASSFAKDVDALYFFILATCAFFTIVVSAAVVYPRHQVPQDARGPDWRAHRGQPAARAAVERDPDDDRDGDVRVGRVGLLPPAHAAGRSAASLRRRQAVDVEVPASRRAARDQRAAPAGRPAGEDHDQLRGRAAQPLLPGVPHQDGRDPRPLHRAVVRSAEAGRVPHLLRRVLRHQPRRHDRQRHRARAGRLPGLAAGRRRGRHARAARREAVQRPGVLDLPPRYRPGPRPVAEGHRRQDRGAAGRLVGGRRRGLPARIDPDLAGEDREGLPAA